MLEGGAWLVWMVSFQICNRSKTQTPNKSDVKTKEKIKENMKSKGGLGKVIKVLFHNP
jgi:hypothetical protein